MKDKMELNADEIELEYKRNLPAYKRLRDEAKFIIQDALKAKDIKIHNVLSRIKKFDSIIDKAQRKKLDNPLNQINDIIGLRIICLFLSDIEKIAEIIRLNFLVMEEDKILGIIRD